MVQVSAGEDVGSEEFLRRATRPVNDFAKLNPERVNAENALQQVTHLLDAAGMAAVAEHMNTSYNDVRERTREALEQTSSSKPLDLKPVLEVRMYSDKRVAPERVEAIEATAANAPKAADLPALVEQAHQLLATPPESGSEGQQALKGIFGKIGMALLDEKTMGGSDDRTMRDAVIESAQRINAQAAESENRRLFPRERIEGEATGAGAANSR